MCIVIAAWKIHPHIKLIVAGNRDEQYQRPTQDADFWSNRENISILGGRDLKAGGMWLGVNSLGCFGTVTNFRDPQNYDQAKKSRGNLVSEYLMSNKKPSEYLSEILPVSKDYNGFSLLVSNRDELGYLSQKEGKVQILESGLYGLSNGVLNEPWPKVVKGKENLEHIIAQSAFANKEFNKLQGEFHDDNEINYIVKEAFKLLENSEEAKEADLPNTGIPKELEKLISPIFVKAPNYGTRASTVVLRLESVILFWERTFDNHGKLSECKYSLTFK